MGRFAEHNVKAKALHKLKNEVSKKSSMANKRLVRLEKNKLTDLSAYQKWVQHDGGVKFSVAGKDYNQLQSELARVNSFINSKSSLVRSANKQMKDIAKDTGMKFESVKELPKKLKGFFELSSKVEQYLRNVESSASAIGYQKIWEVINNYVKEEEVDLSDVDVDVETMIEKVAELLYPGSDVPQFHKELWGLATAIQ